MNMTCKGFLAVAVASLAVSPKADDAGAVRREGTAGIPTAIRGRVEGGQFKVPVTDGWRGTQVAEFACAPRAVGGMG